MDLKTVNISELTLHPDNPHQHPDEQLEALSESLDTFDQVKNVVIWRGLVLAGNGLVTAAQRAGRETIEAQDVSEWDEDKALSFMAADIRLPDMALIDETQMAEVLRRIDEPLATPGFDKEFLEAIGVWEGEPPKEAPPIYIPSQFLIVIECKNEQDQVNALESLTAQGFKCKALIS